MHPSAEQLAASLLYEGYALYPYTPGAAKNATPTPFGIVYPPAYSARQRATFDHLQIECVAVGDSGEVEVVLLFLQAAGARHKAVERRVEVSAALAEMTDSPVERSFAFEPASALGVATGAEVGADGEVLTGTLRLRATPIQGGLHRITARVENTTALPEADVAAMDRAAALRRSMLSVHTMIGLADGRFASPLENEGALGAAVQACENVNSWPVLAAEDDSAVLGAAILLPDHPRISEHSNVNMFDNTEIEEALTLHVKTLTEAERASIEEQDPAVREMIERVEQTTPEQLLQMHGEMKPADPGLGLSREPSFPEWSEPSDGEARQTPPGGAEDVPGEREVVVDGKAFRREGKVILRPGEDGDPYDKMLHGQPATIRRIYTDYDGRVYVGVTVDADPMAEVLRETGRYLFFFADELEAVR